jgi:hypothetical protein
LAEIKNFRVHDEHKSALDYPLYVDARVLAAGVAETVTIPATAKFVVFQCTAAPFYVNYQGTAAAPGADIADGTASELNPDVRYLGSLANFSIVSTNNSIVTMCFYRG